MKTLMMPRPSTMTELHKRLVSGRKKVHKQILEEILLNHFDEWFEYRKKKAEKWEKDVAEFERTVLRGER